MARYIDADKLTDKLEELQFDAPVMTPVMKIYNVIELVEDQPTADVEEVVRCKDCAYYVPLGDNYEYKGKKAMHCFLWAKCTGDNYYCADGMRKEKDNG
jgi:hypothetical protein